MAYCEKRKMALASDHCEDSQIYYTTEYFLVPKRDTISCSMMPDIKPLNIQQPTNKTLSDVHLFRPVTNLIIQDITFCKNIQKCTFAIIYDSVNLPQVKNHWFKE